MPQSATDLKPTESVSITVEDVESVVVDLFESMLGLSVVPTNEVAKGPEYQASISITGEWQSEIHVRTSAVGMRHIACTMFEADKDDLSDEEMLDALGEIANVIGGNIKGIVDLDCRLSLPCVGSADETIQGDLSTSFDLDGEFVEVVLIHS